MHTTNCSCKLSATACRGHHIYRTVNHRAERNCPCSCVKTCIDSQNYRSGVGLNSTSRYISTIDRNCAQGSCLQKACCINNTIKCGESVAVDNDRSQWAINACADSTVKRSHTWVGHCQRVSSVYCAVKRYT